MCPLARLRRQRVFPTMIEPKNLSVVGPTTFFKISYAGLTSVGTLLKIAQKEILSIEISISLKKSNEWLSKTKRKTNTRQIQMVQSISDPRVANFWYVKTFFFTTLKVKMFKQP